MFPILNIEELRARVLRMFGSRLAAKKRSLLVGCGSAHSFSTLSFGLGTLVGISRLHPPGLPYPRLQYLTLAGELLWELGIRCLHFFVRNKG